MERIAFAGNDYLGLARDPRVIEALCRAAREFGVSVTSSRWAVGWTELHAEYERELAGFFGTEDACLLGSAYLGGSAYFEALAATHRVVYCDASCHANLFLGMRGAGFEVHTFRHLDSGDLRAQLACHSGPPPVIATDGVYGISGEVAPLDELRTAARAAEAELFIDDAHGVFVLGKNGRGAAEACGVAPGEATVLGSLSKALGAHGGFLAGTRKWVEQFRRGAVASSSSHPPACIAAAGRTGLRIVREEPAHREKMEAHARRMRAALAQKGLGVVSDRTPIVALVLAGEAEAAALAEHFLAHGLAIPYFKYASEPRHNLLRAVARACYSEDDLARFERALNEWRG